MNLKYWEEVRAVAAAAREQGAANREAFIRQACGGNPEIEADVFAVLNGQPTDTYTPSPPKHDFAPGTVLKGRYLLIRELSRGGFGIVYYAHDQQLHGKPVVVKVRLESLGDDPWFERKFAEEIRALALIDHPGVVGALDSGKTDDGRPFLVMQYVDGRPLRSIISPEGVPLDRVAAIVRQTGHALGAAHDKSIWHRDLKPENIMLQMLPGGTEHVRLIDFGIATIADLQNASRRAPTRVVGSIGYMAPEQVSGQPSPATDIYAFGVIAYELVTGRKPFLPADAGQLAALQRAGVRIKPTDLRPDLPAAAERLILQALSYNPKERPVAAGQFGEDLGRALEGPSAIIEPAPARRWPLKRVALFALPILMAAGVAALLLHRNPAQPKITHGQTQSSGQTIDHTVDPIAHKDGNSPPPPATQPDDAEIAYWKSIKSRNRLDLYRAYLKKYPHGLFETEARSRIDELTPAPKSESTPAMALPRPRPALNADEYFGPLRGELRWSGALEKDGTVTVQGGKSDRGAVAGDLPRVPVSVELPPGFTLAEKPSESNRWDKLVLRNQTGKDVDAISIRWKIAAK